MDSIFREPLSSPVSMDESISGVWGNMDTLRKKHGKINVIYGTRELLSTNVDVGESSKYIY